MRLYVFFNIIYTNNGYSRNTRLRRDFSRPPGERRRQRPFRAAYDGGKRRKKIGSPAAPHSFQDFRRVMRIPNMCLVLESDNGKVVYIADDKTHGQTHPVP